MRDLSADAGPSRPNRGARGGGSGGGQDDDEDDKDPQEFFTGGEKRFVVSLASHHRLILNWLIDWKNLFDNSGLSVQNPNADRNADSIKNILKKAQE